MLNYNFFLYLVCILLGNGLFSSYAAAQIEPVIKYSYFPVQFRSGVKVADMIIADSPHYSVKYKYKVKGWMRWRIEPSPSQLRNIVGNNGGQTNELNITCECHIYLPELQGGTALHKQEFEDEFARIKKHELEHCRIATNYANLLQDQLRSLSAKHSRDLKKQISEKHREIMKLCEEKQDEFDGIYVQGRTASSKAEIDDSMDEGASTNTNKPEASKRGVSIKLCKQVI